MTIQDDILACLESTKLPLTMSDIIYDVSNMPVARGEPRRKVKPQQVTAELNRLVAKGVIESGIHAEITELVYRMKVEKELTQRNLL